LSEEALNNAIVAAGLSVGSSAADIINMLASQCENLMASLVDARLLAPRRIKMPDGGEAIFRIPTDQIPLTEIRG
jgi:hypothetical protein